MFERSDLNQDYENENKEEESHAPNFIRLDQRSKLSIMASILFGLGPHDSGVLAQKEAVELAFSLDRLVGDKLRAVKREKNERIGMKRAV